MQVTNWDVSWGIEARHPLLPRKPGAAWGLANAWPAHPTQHVQGPKGSDLLTGRQPQLPTGRAHYFFRKTAKAPNPSASLTHGPPVGLTHGALPTMARPTGTRADAQFRHIHIAPSDVRRRDSPPRRAYPATHNPPTSQTAHHPMEGSSYSRQGSSYSRVQPDLPTGHFKPFRHGTADRISLPDSQRHARTREAIQRRASRASREEA